MKKLGMLVAVIYAISGGVAQAATTYYVATNGNNNRSCAEAQSVSAPKQTFASGFTCLAAGDTLLVRGGTYDEYINNPALAGTSWSNKIRIASYPGETVWLAPSSGDVYTLYLYGKQQYLEFDGINLNGSGVAYGAAKIEGYDAANGNPHHIRLQNLEVVSEKSSVNTGTFKNGILVAATVPGIIGENELINLTIHSTTAYGIYVSGANNLIDGCNIYDTNVAGIHVSNSLGVPADNNVVRNNRVHDIVSSYDGRFWGIINGSGNPTGTKIYNNVISKIGGDGPSTSGITLYTGTNVEIYNNTVYGNSGGGIAITQSSVSGTVIKNNISYGNAGGDYSNIGVNTAISNNLFGTDPKFANVDAGNFQLQNGSPAIDAGTTVPVTTDASGATRPQGSAFDIGAYEFGSTSSAVAPAAPVNVRIVKN